MNQNPNQPSQEEALTRFIDGEASVPQPSLPPEWLTEKAAAQQVGNLLRAHLPAHQEPPSEEFFVSQLMQKIAEESPQLAPISNVIAPSFWSRFRVWLAPLATAAAVLVVGGVVLQQKAATTEQKLAKMTTIGSRIQAYTPDPKVSASLKFDDSAQATVINLVGLEAVPDTQEIKAYNVASSRASSPGAPQQFFAANDPTKLLFVMFPGQDGAPAIHELH